MNKLLSYALSSGHTWLAALVIAAISAWYFFHPNTGPIRGVYQTPGKYFPIKFFIAYALLRARKWKNTKADSLEQQLVGYGMKSRGSIEDMEKPQILGSHPKAVDAVYFSGFNKDGHYVVLATARCPNKVVNGFAFLRIPEIGLLKLHTLPDSTLYAQEDMKFGAEGILLEPVVPMKKWKAKFDGKMRFENDESKVVNVKMDLEYGSSLNYFDFDTDIPAGVMARALAREPWSKQYFQRLKEAHQTHYEQMGALRGNVIVEGYGTYVLDMDGYRDHSYGEKREWSYMHRYGLHSVALEDGTKFTVGIVSQPVNLSVLEMGYLYSPSGELVGVDWCNLPLHCHGENGTPPMDYSFTFGAGGITYEVQVDVLDLSHLNIGLDWEGRFVERFCKFTVNGMQGWGISEWEYRRLGGRPRQERDPVQTITTK